MKDKNITEGARGVRCNGWVGVFPDEEPCRSVQTKVFFSKSDGLWMTKCQRCNNIWMSRYQSNVNGILSRSSNRQI